jgi:radical SAM/Cys-rich protein
VDRQRGAGVFAASIAGLQRLNALGYGHSGTGLELFLVYNPQGPSLPPPQAALEADYRRELAERHGIVFNGLYALANMPIQRFEAALARNGTLESYRALLRSAHRDANLAAVMCRSLISVDWRGRLHDCDFNQQLGLGLDPADSAAARASAEAGPAHLRDLLHWDPFGAPIRTADHCFGCTAGAGSSCGGALGA